MTKADRAKESVSAHDASEEERFRAEIQAAEVEWRQQRDETFAAKDRRDHLIRRAHLAGFGYGHIAAWLGEVSYGGIAPNRSLVEAICKHRYERTERIPKRRTE